MRHILAEGQNPLLAVQAQVEADIAFDDEKDRPVTACLALGSLWMAAAGAWKAGRAAIGPPLRKVLDLAVVQILVMVLLVVDMSIVLVVTGSPDAEALGSPLWVTSMVLMIAFLSEILLRAYAFGRKVLTLWNGFDTAVIVTSIIVLATASSGGSSSTLVVFGRSVRLLRLVRLVGKFSRARDLASAIGKRLVSQNKRRFRAGAFDLDLTYITDRVIAMSLPSMNVEGFYRNPIDKVADFLDLRHPESYVVVNLCAERNYPGTFFHDRVIRVPFEDHGPPSLAQLVDFTGATAGWLSSSPSRVVAVHCKGGKGRTGTMVAALLLETGAAGSPSEALEWFADRRTHGAKTNQGVSGASQKRYVGYFSLCRLVQVRENAVLFVDFVRIWRLPEVETRNGETSTFHATVDITCPALGLAFSSQGLPRTGAAGLDDVADIDAALGVRRGSVISEEGSSDEGGTSADEDEAWAVDGTDFDWSRRSGTRRERQSGDSSETGSRRQGRAARPQGNPGRGSGGSSAGQIDDSSDDWIDVDCWGVPVASDFRVSLGGGSDRAGTLVFAWVHTGAIAAIADLQAGVQRGSERAKRQSDSVATARRPFGAALAQSTARPATDTGAANSDDDGMPAGSELSRLGDDDDEEDTMDAMALADVQMACGHAVHRRTGVTEASCKPSESVANITLPKEAVDQAAQDSANKTFQPDFRIQVFFSRETPARRRQAHLRRITSGGDRSARGSSSQRRKVPTARQVARKLQERDAAILRAEAQRSTALQ